jgi:guanine deaminase
VPTSYRAQVLTPLSSRSVQYLPDGVVTVDEQGTIVSVGAWSGESCDVDLRPHVLVPGFVDAHVHFPQTRIVGRASGPLLTWLAQDVFPEEARFAEDSYAQQVAVEFCAALASSGTTFVMAYGSVHPSASEVLLETMDAAGLRGAVGPVLMDRDCPPGLQLSAEEALPALEELAARWHGHDEGRLQVAVIPRFALSCSDAMLRGAADLADRLQLPVTTHLAETPAEYAAVRAHFGTEDYLSVYADRGLVTPGSVFAHCLHLQPREWDTLAASEAVVAHCPDSNAFLGSGGMPLDPIWSRNIQWAMGTDVAAGRSFRVPRALSFAHDNARAQGAELSPESLFWRGTRGGALALGEPRVGAIEAGLQADMSLWRVPPWVSSAADVLATLIFDHDGPPALKTWVKGREVWSTI